MSKLIGRIIRIGQPGWGLDTSFEPASKAQELQAVANASAGEDGWRLKNNPSIRIGDKTYRTSSEKFGANLNTHWEHWVYLMDNTPCICDGLHSVATGPDDMMGHKNSAGGYCCPHHGNTCGTCPENDHRG